MTDLRSRCIVTLMFLLLCGTAASVHAQNPGFESISGRTIWNNFALNGWTYDNNFSEIGEAPTWSNPAFIRSGEKGIEIIASGTGVNNNWRASNYSVTIPGSGSWYVHMLGYATQATSNKCTVAPGVYSGGYSFGTAVTPGTSFGSISYSAAATNGATYYPAFRVKQPLLGSYKTGLDDIIIYYDQQSSADLTAPAAATGLSAAVSGSQCTLNFTEGADNSGGSGLEGYLILRCTGAGVTLPSVLPQTMYSSSSSSIGPVTLTVSSPYEQWQVVYNGAASSGSYTDNISTGTTYTYLIYMRDKAYNYSSPRRVMVVNSSLSLNNNVALDAIYLQSGQLQVNSGKTLSFNSGCGYGANTGKILNDGIVSIPNGTSLNMSGSFQNGNGVLNIENGGALNLTGTLDNLWTNSKVVLKNGGTLTIASTGALNNEQGILDIQSGATVVVNGAINNKTSVNVATGASLSFRNGATYNHLRQGGAIPAASWADGSNCVVKGESWYSNNVPAGLGQSFANFKWDWANQGGDMDLDGALNNVRGAFTLQNTNGGNLILESANNSNNSYNFGNLVINGGNLLLSSCNNATPVLNIAGNFVVNGGSFSGADRNNTSPVINVGGAVLINGGSVTSSQANNPSASTWNLEGSLIVSSPGNFTAYAGSKSFDSYQTQINFSNTSGNDSSSYLKLPTGLDYKSASLWRFNIKTGRSITLLSDVELGGSSASGNAMLTIENGATLHAGTHKIYSSTGASNTGFTMEAGATLSIGDENGINKVPATTGNILTGSRNYNASANYIYTGSATQSLGDAFPGTVNQLILDNPNGMTLQEDLVVNDTLKLMSGTLNIGNHKLVIKSGIKMGGGQIIGGSQSEIEIENTTGSDPLQLQGVELRKLKVNCSAGVILMGELIIHDSVEMVAGLLNTGSFCVSLGTTASVQEKTTSYILGCVSATRDLSSLNTVYDFGSTGMALNFSGYAPGSTQLTRRTGSANTSGANVSIKRSYTIHTGINTGLGATMYFKYLDSELNGIDEANLVLFRSTDSGQTWTNRGHTAHDTVNNLLTLTNIDGFSDWTGGDDLSPLPVALVSFKAKANGNDAVLEWATASETNNDRFEIERSNNGMDWNRVYTVLGQGTTQAYQSYTHTDREALSLLVENIYYRLKQVDHNGEFEYSPIVILRKDHTLEVDKLWYNSHTSQLHINMRTAGDSRATIHIYDLQGNEISAYATRLAPGSNSVQIAAGKLAEGMYLVKINTGAEALTHKIMVRN